MQNYKQHFKGKKITVMGLGLLGRGIGYTKFLAECGADLIVTDLKTKEQLKASVEAITNYELRIKNKKKIKFVLGEHRLEDFKDRDMIIKAAGVPLDSIYIKEAEKNNIPVEMDVSLFAKCVPEVMLIGVTGTRGKSMTTALIYEILKQNEKFLKRKVYIGGNVRGVATLPLLKKVKDGDILVCELDSWQLQGFGDAKMSPHISVFTSFMPDHMNYYGNSMERYFGDKANIFKYQKDNDVLIVRPHIKKIIKKKIKSKLIVADLEKVNDFDFIVPGEHQKENLACAVEVAELFKIPKIKIKNIVAKFKGLEGRLQYLKTIKGIRIYNDNNATTPEATIAGIKALYQEGKEEKIILISGGADKNLDLSLFINVVNTFCKVMVLIPGSGTERLIKNYKLRITNKKVKNLKDAIKEAIKISKRGDVILFSPAFASFGQFNNEYERNDLFVKIIKKLK
ncbi:MAG: UDP-N-acetylmuramoylalanine-D-glutamate ligase [Candidatus Nomurabacteria bacterium GW2011_GWE1_32_28]|uniref:UDP-N-acetylmuramoylalanine--D-glutamate ligase n=1 Tax=Candidatus Nomurabacteria bacterium GW2011_GWF1_31_48 TaxID=1618767 RepID=A0A0G0BHX6_9BACT|nr:MAG: UDP-N-acetylmuramoylalanine-D-glutamate ligase [Candidatus Nomurabacteria bacterium GW2011_GWF2_30_133]KKP28884.1 MAG: UDP-N-acetylmuramoylalanine-D-glutamate ligase [Candidatus Nomurabacteria bacterium GW2011_GWE2_31_40]KKP30622.1 MAG: UDP-N-acetylmuramoylalanine-D-glutamate ligase [Candidatus Nomurabacteria bacterium GW2011_GWF1_31_48]KKP35140.1 MAG: UDP-N-acetylmuramoylalanine-D-glutamate ligase [Candidatus Nomurabacteria bacterium GW2011_GWE1_32_28]HAS80450.1 UDP-N-acetylmuramoyl-L-